MEPIHNIDPPVGFAHQPIQPDLAKPVESKQTQDDKQDWLNSVDFVTYLISCIIFM